MQQGKWSQHSSSLAKWVMSNIDLMHAQIHTKSTGNSRMSGYLRLLISTYSNLGHTKILFSTDSKQIGRQEECGHSNTGFKHLLTGVILHCTTRLNTVEGGSYGLY